MTEFDFDTFRHLNVKAFQRPSIAVSFAVSSLIVAFLYAILIDFSKSYIKAPKHFPPRGWFVTFLKPNVNAPLIKLGAGGHREALERGSRIVSTFAPIPTMDKDNSLFSSIRTSLTEFLTIQMSGSSFHTR